MNDIMNIIDFKKIHIGNLVEIKWKESGISIERICTFFKLEEKEIIQMFLAKTIQTEYLLKWSKLLEYDFFRLYSQHLILYSPPAGANRNSKMIKEKTVSLLPGFRKNLYTWEIIQFLLELLDSGEKTKKQIIEEYKIPKTTLYKWINKYR